MSRSGQTWQQKWRLIVCDAPADLIDAKTKLVALVLSTYGNNDGTEVFPGETRLSEDTGLSLSSVRRATKKLRDLGLLSRVSEGTKQGRRGWADKYALIADGPIVRAWTEWTRTPVRETGARATPSTFGRDENTGQGDR